MAGTFYSVCIVDSYGLIMFVDVVGFSELASVVAPLEIVAYLSEVFNTLEEISIRHGMEKIKTIGDALMAAIGLPDPVPGHAVAAARCALEILHAVALIRDPQGRGTQVRIGLHSGPCAGGVVGARKISFDIWGDTVNMASRMQTSAEVNTALCSQATASLIGDEFELSFMGLKEIKGRGSMQTYQIIAERPHIQTEWDQASPSAE